MRKIISLAILLTANFANAQIPTNLLNGLVAYYPFSGNATDASGNGNNGTVNGAILTQDRFGNPNAAYSFNGQSSIISIPNFTQADGNAHTLSMWVNSSLNQWVDLIAKDDPGASIRQWVLQWFWDAHLIYAVFNSSGEHDLNSTNQLATNQWYQIVCTWDGQTQSIYINSQFDSSIPSTGVLNQYTPSLPIYLGGDPAIPSFFYGDIDDVRIYNRALTAAEIQQLFVYESGPQISLIQAVMPSFSNLSFGTNYQLQVSSNLNTWVNQGTTFIATNTSMNYPQYFNVSNWSQLYFRLQVVP